MTSEPFVIEKEGVQPVVMLLADAGYSSYGALIETSANGGERIAVQAYEYLPATPANLALVER